MDKASYLHIYSQAAWHEDAIIIGDKAALLKLKKAVEEALKSTEGIGIADLFVNDGEGYDLMVVRKEDLSQLKPPYTDEMTAHLEGIHPWDGLTPAQQEKVQIYWDFREGRWSSINKRKQENNLFNKVKRFFTGEEL